ncbi:MAG: hypothetical protein QOF61_2221 [Acidobacteriota bacterium]|nr:hypothetical protein [Acidobacteriota bacterium]
MRIVRKRFTISLVLVASLLLPSVTLAQGTTVPTRDWSGLRTVPSGSKLVVKLKNGKTVEGNLSGVSDAALSVSVSNNSVDLNRDDVLRVYQVGGKSAKNATLIGAAVGAGAGAAVGAAGGDSDGFAPTKGQLAAGLAVLGAGVGALVGFAVGKSGHKRVLIYEAK